MQTNLITHQCPTQTRSGQMKVSITQVENKIESGPVWSDQGLEATRTQSKRRSFSHLKPSIKYKRASEGLVVYLLIAWLTLPKTRPDFDTCIDGLPMLAGSSPRRSFFVRYSWHSTRATPLFVLLRRSLSASVDRDV